MKISDIYKEKNQSNQMESDVPESQEAPPKRNKTLVHENWKRMR